jgi:hypothetical protein
MRTPDCRPEIHIVVELIGGTTIAKEITLRSDQEWKTCMTEQGIARNTWQGDIQGCERSKVKVGFEAS